MRIIDFYNLLAVMSCPNCGEDPGNLNIESVDEDNIVCACGNCHSRIKITYNTEVIKDE